MGTVRRLSVATLCSLLLILLGFGYSEAQLPAANAEVKVIRGRAEVLRKGQTAWTPLAQGARLAEGDHVRTGAGGSVDVALPDGSTLQVAENTRYVVTKLQYSAQSRERNFGFHVVTGKLKADVSRAAVQAARARQANFFVSTPNGVAAVRGTVNYTQHSGRTGQSLVAAFASTGQAPATAVITYISLSTGSVMTITANTFVTVLRGARPSFPAGFNSLPPGVQRIFLSLENPESLGDPALTGDVVIDPRLTGDLIDVGPPLPPVQIPPQAPPAFSPP